MKCTAMENRDERHPWPAPGSTSYRMNLHCFDSNCARNMPFYFGPYMQVICTPNLNWRCIQYGLPFQFGSFWFVLHGSTSQETWIEPKSPIPIRLSINFAKTAFIPISTGDDMHLHARSIFDQLSPKDYVSKLQKLSVLA